MNHTTIDNRRVPLRTIVAVQAVCLVLVAASLAGLFARGGAVPPAARDALGLVVPIERRFAHRIEPLYDDPEIVSDAQLAAVLAKIVPRFSRDEMHPNYLEHALRTWGVDATFAEPDALSGAEMRDFLLDHGRQIEVFGFDSEPLLIDQPRGVGVRWEQSYDPRASAHHDHLLASLSEAGVPLDWPVIPPSGREMTFDDVLQEAIRDFRLEEVETEWSAMSFALWLAPETTRFHADDGREITFDLLARRLMRSHRQIGVCHGTHRVYTLLVLWRLNEAFDRSMLSDDVRQEVWRYLEGIRDLITVSQFDEGYWPSNWADGRRAVENPLAEEDFQRVIATGHHLEWLALAPRELHPPREQILRAAAWVIATTVNRPDDEVRRQYTFYSHIGNSLCLWRNTRPADFWQIWSGAPREEADAPPQPAPDLLLPEPTLPLPLPAP